MKQKKNRYKRALLILSSLLLCFCICDIFLSKYFLKISNYRIQDDKITEDFRVVQISDLHNSKFGKNNTLLVKKIKTHNPDLIFITGDLINSDELNTEIATELLTQLTEIAPTYVSYGNHEYNYEKLNNTHISDLYENCGAHVLDYKYEDIIVKNQKVRIGGIYGYCCTETYSYNSQNMLKQAHFVQELQDTNNLSILLCHLPDAWLDWGSLYLYDVNYVFSGHLHGGQIRIPWIGGLWTPETGFFPGRVCGVYEPDLQYWNDFKEQQIKYVSWAIQQIKEKQFDDVDSYKANRSYTDHYLSELYDRQSPVSKLILTTGLGNNEKIPRFNNIPEIVVVDFVPVK